MANARPESPVRSLIYIPIIHGQADMGALGTSVQQVKVRKLGRRGWEQNLNLIEVMWREIEQAVDGWTFAYERVRVYQDGLPDCGREIAIVTALAKAGSRNHQLLLRLKEKGATIMGTESSELLVEEYRLVKEVLASRDPAQAVRVEARQKALGLSLLKRRDQYIADRINRTLCPGETGILFLGMLHAVAHLLPHDIPVTYPVHRPLAEEIR